MRLALTAVGTEVCQDAVLPFYVVFLNYFINLLINFLSGNPETSYKTPHPQTLKL